ncbi:MAG: 50S ribosomal protein L22 [Thermoprotei archaeon]
MPSAWTYPNLGVDDTKLGKAVKRDIRASVRDLYNVCKAIRGMKVSEAEKFLNDVLAGKQALPFWRHQRGASHRSNISPKWKVKSGRYPKKAIKYVLEALGYAKADALRKGLSEERLKVLHAAAHKGITIKRYMPRAFGRSTRKFRYTSHIEIVVGEA